MTRDREVAEALSDGINCIHAIVTALQSGAPATPDPEWLTILRGMEAALDATMAKEVLTSTVVSEEARDRVRRVRVLVSDWTTTGHPPSELRMVAEAVLRSFGLPT